jgi:hypothetical protein
MDHHNLHRQLQNQPTRLRGPAIDFLTLSLSLVANNSKTEKKIPVKINVRSAEYHAANDSALTPHPETGSDLSSIARGP